ncbi:MAG TPA: lytic transglycosylase domain-containing protein [Alphaproteobacteria bacterium]|nr:lytic transglycosylase domain-containing protein [Alphaproteobacteria bacterium]
MEWLFNLWRQESRVLRDAPIAFVLTLALAFFLSFFVLSWHYSERMEVLSMQASFAPKNLTPLSLEQGLVQIESIQKHISDEYPEMNTSLGWAASSQEQKNMRAQALAVCVFAAARVYEVPVDVLIAILVVEKGYAGQETKSGKYSYLGVLQISSLWAEELAAYWRVSKNTAYEKLKDDPCANIAVGAWILANKINEYGGLYKALGYYNSSKKYMQPERMDSEFRERILQETEKLRKNAR